MSKLDTHGIDHFTTLSAIILQVGLADAEAFTSITEGVLNFGYRLSAGPNKFQKAVLFTC